jgi:hypothetical protein
MLPLGALDVSRAFVPAIETGHEVSRRAAVPSWSATLPTPLASIP